MAAQVQKFIELREQYRSTYLLLLAQRDLPSEQAQFQRIGRCETFDWVIHHLESLHGQMKPADWLPGIETLLDDLASTKVSWLIQSIRERRTHGLNQLAEYKAEGAIAQIDGILEDVLSRLPHKWRATSPKQHGRFFHLFHSLVADVVIDNEVGAKRWFAPERSQWYQEVAIVRALYPEDQMETLYRLTSQPEWMQKPQVLWLRKNSPQSFGVPAVPFVPRVTEPGDVLVSVSSGTAWMISGVGFQVLAKLKDETVRGDSYV